LNLSKNSDMIEAYDEPLEEYVNGLESLAIDNRGVSSNETPEPEKPCKSKLNSIDAALAIASEVISEIDSLSLDFIIEY